MNGILLQVILQFCLGISRTPHICIDQVLQCAILNKVYESDEQKATQVVAGCIIRRGSQPWMKN